MKGKLVDLPCDVCSRTVLMPEKQIEATTRTCGMKQCDAIALWTEEAWEDRARMAAVREAAGADLDRLDLMALGRLERPRTARRRVAAPPALESGPESARAALRASQRLSKGRRR